MSDTIHDLDDSDHEVPEICPPCHKIYVSHEQETAYVMGWFCDKHLEQYIWRWAGKGLTEARKKIFRPGRNKKLADDAWSTLKQMLTRRGLPKGKVSKDLEILYDERLVDIETPNEKYNGLRFGPIVFDAVSHAEEQIMVGPKQIKHIPAHTIVKRRGGNKRAGADQLSAIFADVDRRSKGHEQKRKS